MYVCTYNVRINVKYDKKNLQEKNLYERSRVSNFNFLSINLLLILPHILQCIRPITSRQIPSATDDSFPLIHFSFRVKSSLAKEPLS